MAKEISFIYEDQYPDCGVMGVDEVGIGPWAGPVVAAAVHIHSRDGIDLSLLNDSKALSPKKRDIAYTMLTQTPHVTYAVGVASVAEVDTLNVRAASLLAMSRAMAGIPSASIALIDGIAIPSSTSVKCLSIIKGDRKSYSIAAASILAKVERDRFMCSLDTEYPNYGFSSHKGYGTVQHRQALSLYGVTVHHRRSYAPIRALLS